MSATSRQLLSSLFICYSLLSPVHTHVLTELQISGREFTNDFLQMNTAFPITRIYLFIPEELPPGSLVTDLNLNPQVKNIQAAFKSSSTPLSFQYRLMNTYDSRLFRIGSHSGRMTVASRLDREMLCASQKAQFCCNTRNSLPSSLFSDPNWIKDNNSIPIGQRCHLVAHITIQSSNARNEEVDSPNPPNQMALIYVYIRVDDVNDHTPQFTIQSNSLNVAEDTPVGTVLQYFLIADPDAGENGLAQVKLDVTPMNVVDPKKLHDNPDALNLLKANPFETQLSREGVSLLLVRALDREAISAYDVILTAIDGDRLNPRSSQLNLRVHVTDSNDNPPVWIIQSDQNSVAPADYLASVVINKKEVGQNPRFNVTVPENTQVGALIYWLQAKDPDIGDNARLQYSIDTSAPGGLTALDHFSVQPTTGEVRLRSQLDYDLISQQLPRPEMEVPVIVRDSPRVGRQLSSKATLVVHITDVNDMYPIIMVSPLQPIPSHGKQLGHALSEEQPQTVFGVWENRSPGQPIASISVNDPDTGDGGRVTCSVQSDFFTLAPETEKYDYYTEFQNPSILGNKHLPITADAPYPDPVTYHLLSSQRLDREAIPNHQIVLTCKDHDKSRPLVSTQRLDIEVLDENDNPPEFPTSVIVLTCVENSPPGQIIGRVNATDKDLGENARLRYWVDDRDASWVGVQALTGEVRVNAVFDRETEKEREFMVYVVDSDGPTRHTASATVKIQILDENDHPPVFTDLYFFSIPENSPPGTEVGVVQAEDEDFGDNGKVSYHFSRFM
ncbi:Protocadherin-11 Y-linked [Fasciolopsis buskii]|uniref:Protocadherin-11 Y-linked n=1 Tax=Fasciolopsis buskii TaxID=27845 RepID=A0A8E0VR34_9TREM|nr:Protocadherin-11 Y-linked [Fasciolopsis buski]